jgi:hypothetical protein
MKERRGDEAPLYVEGCVRLALGGVAAVAVIRIYVATFFAAYGRCIG